MRNIQNETSGRRARWGSILASGAVLSMMSGCVTPWGELGGVGESEGDSLGDPDPGGTSGAEGGESDEDGESGESGETDGPEMACSDVGPSDARLLTRFEYTNTIRDLFALAEGPWTDANQDPWDSAGGTIGPFDVMFSTPTVGAGYAARAAEVAQAMSPATLLPCPVEDPDPQGCAATFVPQLGRAIWRRPLTEAETADLLTHYAALDLVEGTRAVVEQMLASPEFYTLREQGTPSAGDPDILVLDQYSVAARLSYFLWGSTPDAILLGQADAGALADPSALVAEAQRMMADPRATASVGEMYAQWFDARDLASLTKADPVYDAALASAMETELRMVAGDVVLGQGDGRLATLLQTPQTFVDDGLAALYGVDVLSTTGTPGPGAFVPAELDPDRRRGLLTLPALMTRYSNRDWVGFAQRGNIVSEALLCLLIPPPPPDVQQEPPPEGNRYEAIDELLDDPNCGACHKFLEPVQVAFDTYDELGRWQDEIDGVPVQTEGELEAISGQPTFEDHAELVNTLLSQPETRECMVHNHMRFALRRVVDESDDACTTELLVDRMEASDDDLNALMLDIVESEAFRLVRPL